MTSWVYIFSQFTPEALLFEALIIMLLFGGYGVFWVLRKRRFGSVDADIPSGPVKSYLNGLIANAEQLRLQLFGLLGSTGTPVNVNALMDADSANKLALLEAKLKEQQANVDHLTNEKARLEKELSNALAAVSKVHQNATPTAAATPAGSSAEVSQLQTKIQELEGRLFEYSVIEDDLANLKRLQQENALLKSTLSGKGIPLPDLESGKGEEAPPPAPAPSAPAPPVAAATPPQPAPPPPAAPPEASPTSDQFAALDGSVEKSLPGADAVTPPQESTASTPDIPAITPPPAGEGGNDDLVSEFEKMLKG